MIKLWKPGTVGSPKIKLGDSQRGAIARVVFVWTFITLACTRTYVGPADLTATVAARQPGQPAAVTSEPAAALPATPQPVDPQPQPTAAAIGSGGEQAPPRILDTVQPAQPEKPKSTRRPPILYYAQAGDTLPAAAVRFGVAVEQITSPDPLPAGPSLLRPGQLLLVPAELENTSPETALLPDSEIVYSPSALDFNINEFVQQGGGYLVSYRESLSSGTYTGAEIVERVAVENSINPRLLLALLEYRAHWVYGTPQNFRETDFPIGNMDVGRKGLYKQLSWAVEQLSLGYYGWRAGLITTLDFRSQRDNLRLAPTLNAGSVAIQYLFASLMDQSTWSDALYTPNSFPNLYEQMFGNPWSRAQSVEPLYPPNLQQPQLDLPFKIGSTWSLTGGPHSAWGPNGALAALDFAPPGVEHGCGVSDQWVTAMAAGLVLRADNGAVLVDLDGDGHEQTGWVILYMHIANASRVEPGTWVTAGDLIGHPSCEGGVSTGTHVHVARKYNGEWILADGPLSFEMSGWRAHAGREPYKGSLTNGDQTAEANTFSSYETRVTRTQ